MVYRCCSPDLAQYEHLLLTEVRYIDNVAVLEHHILTGVGKFIQSTKVDLMYLAVTRDFYATLVAVCCHATGQIDCVGNHQR